MAEEGRGTEDLGGKQGMNAREFRLVMVGRAQPLQTASG